MTDRKPNPYVLGLIVVITLLALAIAATGHCAGLAFDDSFIVLTPPEANDDQYASEVLREAARFQDKFAMEWLGQPAAGPRTAVNVSLSADDDSGWTWAKDDANRILNNIYLTTNRERAAGSTLHHEVVHATLANAFPHPNRLPSWIEEGIAVRFDDAERKLCRKETLRWWLANHRIPQLADVFSRHVQSSDDDGYTASGLLVDYLLTLGDKQTVVRCGALCRTNHEQAFAECYGLTLAELQRGWEAFIRSRV